MVRGFSPLDEELELGAEHLSPWLVEATVRLGTWMPFGRVPEALAFFTRVEVDRDTARRLTEQAGRALEAAETATVKQLEEAQPEAPAGPAVQQLSADGAMVPLVGGEWAEVKTVAVGTVTQRTTARGARVVQTRDLSYFSRLADHTTFERLAWGELHRRGLPRAGVVVGVMDGSEWLQGFLDYHRPDAVRILDFPHAVEHLSHAVQTSIGAGSAATAWRDEQAHELKTGDPAAVLAAVCALPTATAPDPPQAEQARDQTLEYLVKRWDHLQYAQFQAQGYPIGSGAVERANKLVVEARLKGSGMHWARPNVNPLLALRCAACSDRWNEAWSQLCRQQREQAAAQRGRRWAAKRPTPLPPPVTDPVPPPALPPTRDHLVHPSPTRAPLVVNGHPTAHHPWKRFALLRHRRPCAARRAKL